MTAPNETERKLRWRLRAVVRLLDLVDAIREPGFTLSDIWQMAHDIADGKRDDDTRCENCALPQAADAIRCEFCGSRIPTAAEQRPERFEMRRMNPAQGT